MLNFCYIFLLFKPILVQYFCKQGIILWFSNIIQIYSRYCSSFLNNDQTYTLSISHIYGIFQSNHKFVYIRLLLKLSMTLLYCNIRLVHEPWQDYVAVKCSVLNVATLNRRILLYKYHYSEMVRFLSQESLCIFIKRNRKLRSNRNTR